MASKRRIRRRACKSKEDYFTEAAANRVAASMRRMYSGRYRAYKCQFCPNWHVGRIDSSQVRAIEARRSGTYGWGNA